MKYAIRDDGKIKNCDVITVRKCCFICDRFNVDLCECVLDNKHIAKPYLFMCSKFKLNNYLK